MSFKGFVDTDIEELRKNLKKRSKLASEFKEQIDNQQGISNYVKEIAIKQSKPIVDAIAKERDERLKTTTGVSTDAEEKRILDSNPMAMLEYFRTLRPDLIKDPTESELSLLTFPIKLMKSDISILSDGKRAVLSIPRQGLADYEEELDLPLTWMLMFDMKTLQKYNLLKDITEQDIQKYVNILTVANNNKVPINTKIGELKDTYRKLVQTVSRFPPFEDPDILNMTFMGLLDYILKLSKNPQTKDNKVVKAFIVGNPTIGRNPVVIDDAFLYSNFDGKTPRLTISSNDGTKGTRSGTVELGSKYKKENVGDVITIHFQPRTLGDPVVKEKFAFQSPYTKIQLLLSPFLPILKSYLRKKYKNDTIYDSIYDLVGLPKAESDLLDADMRPIIEWINQLNIGPDGTPQTGLGMSRQKQPAYGVLRDPFKDAKTTKPKGNVVHRSYNIVDGKFGDLLVDVPKLYTKLHLTAKKGGTIIFDKPVDKDTLDLLTTHPKRKRVYSKQAVKTLAKLIELSDQPIKPGSRKLQMVQKYHNKKRASVPINAEDVSLDRLTTLILEHQAGNYPNAQLQSEIAQQADSLLKQALITDKMHKQIYSKYVMQ